MPSKRRFNGKLKMVFMVLLVILSCIALIAAIILSATRQDSAIPVICETKDCEYAGKYLNDSINRYVNPCDDFFEYSCGNWREWNEIPTNQKSFGVTDVIRNHIDDSLIKMLNINASSDDNLLKGPIKDTYQYFKSCMDTKRIDSVGFKPLLAFIETIGSWPLKMGDKWTDKNYNWLTVAGTILNLTGTNYIIRWSIAPHPSDNKKNIIWLGMPSFMFPTEYLSNKTQPGVKPFLDANKNFTDNLLALILGADKNFSAFHDELFDFESQLYNLNTTNKTFDGNQETPIRLKELQTLIPRVDWLGYMKIFTKTALDRTNDKVTEEEELVLKDKVYLMGVVNLLTTKDMIRKAANYLVWRMILSRATLLPTQHLDVPEDRTIICLDWIRSAFAEVIAHLYIKSEFPPAAKEKTKTMVFELKDEFMRKLTNADWMDSLTKASAIKKLERMKIEVAYHDWLTNITNLETIFEDMGMIGEDVFHNSIVISAYSFRKTVTSLRNKTTGFNMLQSPIEPNAVYSRGLNGILISAALLQSPFFYQDTPSYLNYAAIGSVIGHEFTHGFDTEGSKRDENGQFINWWSQSSAQQFENRTKCFVSQYDRYKLNGRKTIQENIADTGGLRLAFHAYKHMIEKTQTTESKLKELSSYNIDQLFFLAYGSIWCNNYQKEALHEWEHLSHSPPEFRLIGSLSNLPEFATAFNCSSESKLNPKTKCLLW